MNSSNCQTQSQFRQLQSREELPNINQKIKTQTSNQHKAATYYNNNKLNKNQPGLYFDDNNRQVNQREQLDSAQSQPAYTNQIINNKLPSNEKAQRLYSPYEYMHYATKVNNSKESYINALQQLGYDSAPLLTVKPLNDIMNKTHGLIKQSYSVKYIGVIDGNMGILSRRLKLQQSAKPFMNNIEQGANINPKYQQQFQANQHQRNEEQNDQYQQQQLQEDQTVKLPKKDTVPKPETYNNYIIGKYALPKYLKTIRKQRDPSKEIQRQNLEAWHAEKLRGVSSQNQHQNSTTATLETQASKQLKKGKGGFIKKKPIQNFEENQEEGVCYAIIEKPQDREVVSYSRLLNQMDDHFMAMNKNMNQLTLNGGGKSLSVSQINAKKLEYQHNEQLSNYIEKIIYKASQQQQ